ncbi:MAG: hypothetical protein V4850_16420 [Myxococcota bacterium]
MYEHKPDLGRRCRSQAALFAAHARGDLSPDALLAAVEREVAWTFQGFYGTPASWVFTELEAEPVIRLVAGWRALLHAASDTGEGPEVAWRWFDDVEHLPMELLRDGPAYIHASLEDSGRRFLPVMAMWRVWRSRTSSAG